MKTLHKVYLAGIIFLLSVSTADACHSRFWNWFSYQDCETELPLVYRDAFDQFDTDFWIVEEGRVKHKNRGWVKLQHATVTSIDQIDRNLGRFQLTLRFRNYRRSHSRFAIQFIGGEELLFSYQPVKIKKRKRTVTRNRFAVTAWPEMEEQPVPLRFHGWWKTLLVAYDPETGMVYLDTDNDCSFDHVLQWKKGLQYSHVTGSGQKWDLFQLNAEAVKKAEHAGSLPAYEAQWTSVGEETHGLAVDSLGRVYVASSTGASVRQFNENGNLIAEWSDFQNPKGISVDSSDNIYIVDAGSSSVQKYDAAGNKVSELPQSGPGYDTLGSLNDIAVDGDGIIYVPSFNVWFDGGIVMGVKILRFSSDWGYLGEIIPGIDSPVTGIDVDGQGNIYLTNPDGIQVFDSDGTFLRTVGAVTGSGEPGEFAQGSYDVAVAANGDLFAVDGGANNRIQAFDATGTFQFNWGQTGTEPGDLDTPRRVVVTRNNVYILDSGNNRVQKFQY